MLGIISDQFSQDLFCYRIHLCSRWSPSLFFNWASDKEAFTITGISSFEQKREETYILMWDLFLTSIPHISDVLYFYHAEYFCFYFFCRHELTSVQKWYWLGWWHLSSVRSWRRSALYCLKVSSQHKFIAISIIINPNNHEDLDYLHQSFKTWPDYIKSSKVDNPD